MEGRVEREKRGKERQLVQRWRTERPQTHEEFERPWRVITDPETQTPKTKNQKETQS